MNYLLKVSPLLISALFASACGGGSTSSGSDANPQRRVLGAVPTTVGIPGPEIPATRQGAEFLAEQCISIDRAGAPTNVIIFNICDQRIITRDFFPLGQFERRIYPIEPDTGIRFLENATRVVPVRVPSCFSPYVPAGRPTIEEYSCLLP